MLTPLKPHHGQHGGLVALGLLLASSAVVWVTHPRDPEPAAQISGETVAKPALAGAVAAAASTERAPAITSDRTVATVLVGERDFEPRVVASGIATYDETRTARVNVAVHGWLEKTRPTSLGRRVRQGELLGVVYSAEVYFATAELVKQVREFHSQEELDRQRVRLLGWGMPRDTLDRIENTLRPQATLPVVARLPGTVVAEQGQPRQVVDPYSGRELFTISDPSYAWAFVDVPDGDAARVRVGAPARLRIEGVARPLGAKVGYVWRRGEDGMRKVRLDLHAAQLAIAPNTAVRAELSLGRMRGLGVPRSAVVRDGARTLVFVVQGTSLNARDVKLGTGDAGFYRVEAGLAAGERIALHAEQLAAQRR